MAEVKGVILNAQSLFLKTCYSDAELQQATAALAPDDAALLKPRYLDAGWYPYQSLVALRRLMRALPQRPGSGPADVGAFIAEHAYTGVYQGLLAKDPAKLVGNMAWLHNLVYRDMNALDARITGDGSCAMVYRYESGVRPTRAVCQSLIGFWGKVLELATGAKASGAHPACVCEGAERCEFTFAW